MTWVTLSEFTPTFERQDIATVFPESVILRVTNNWEGGDTFPGFAFIYLMLTNGRGDVFAIRKVYPFKVSRVIELNFPEEVLESEQRLFRISQKINSYGRFDADANWRVKVERFLEPVDTVEDEEYQEYLDDLPA